MLGEEVRKGLATHYLRETKAQLPPLEHMAYNNPFDIKFPDKDPNLKAKDARTIQWVTGQQLLDWSKNVIGIDTKGIKASHIYYLYQYKAPVYNPLPGGQTRVFLHIGEQPKFDDASFQTKHGVSEYMKWLWLYDRVNYEAMKVKVLEWRAQYKEEWKRAWSEYMAQYRAAVAAAKAAALVARPTW
jgi:hypothetical protein